MVIQIVSTWASPISTDLGIIYAGQTLTVTLPPDKAQMAAYGLTTLVNAGKLTLTLLPDQNLLPIFNEEGGGGGVGQGSFVTGATTMRGIVKLYDSTSASFKYLYIDNGNLTLSDSLPS